MVDVQSGAAGCARDGWPTEIGDITRPLIRSLFPDGASLAEPSRLVLAVFSRGSGKLGVERLPVADAATEELWPLRNYRDGIGLFRQQAPELRMVPAQLVLGAVAMLADTLAKAANLGHELVA